jgi:hypothetical protein
VIAHAQKPGFVFRRNGTSPFKSAGASFQSTVGSRGVRISGSNAGYTMFRGSVKCTGYPLHSPVSPSLRLPCVTVCRHISTGLYVITLRASDDVGLLRELKYITVYLAKCLTGQKIHILSFVNGREFVAVTNST